MSLSRVALAYLTPSGHLERLRGHAPLGDMWMRLEVAACATPATTVTTPVAPSPGRELLLRVTAAEPGLRLLRLTLDLDDVNLRDRFLANGFQSWSETRLLGPDDRLPGLRLLPFLRPYGDYTWVPYDGRPGRFHSHWLTYTCNAGAEAASGALAGARGSSGPMGTSRFTFLGSLNEANAYTVFHVDYRASGRDGDGAVTRDGTVTGDGVLTGAGAATEACRLTRDGGDAGPAPARAASRGRLWAEIDVEGLEPRPGDTLAHLYWAEGSTLPPLVRDFAARLAEIMKAELGDAAPPDWLPGTLIPCPPSGTGTGNARALPHRPGGWNSWYNYYNRVTAKDILAETDALRSAGLPLDFVQIDDGWQAAVGDWLEPSPRFAGVRERGRSRPAGGSGAAAAHLMPDLAASIRDAGFTPGIWVAPFVAIRQSSVFRRGWVHPWKAGWNPLWGSSIYALDLSRPEVVDHVRRVGDTFRNWGFGLVKADFLYAAALRPWGGRTRAQRMREAMRLLRQVMPGQLLACGVPLASAAGLCDFNRLGPDTAPKWEDSLLSFCRYRERVSNLNALRTILARWFMNGTLFALDPDVFILGQSKLTPAERQTLFDVTTTLGGMQSFSDSIGRLAPEARDLVKRVFPLADLAVLSVTEEAPDLFGIAAPSGGGDRVLLRVNLADRPQGGLPPHTSEWNRLPNNH